VFNYDANIIKIIKIQTNKTYKMIKIQIDKTYKMIKKQTNEAFHALKLLRCLGHFVRLEELRSFRV